MNTRYQAYFHYNLCTFKNVADSEKHHGRASGREPVSMWNPSGLDCDQWAQVCVDSRMAGGWLTSKHHGGFCLWDSAHTEYDVASAPVKTDVVAEFVKAFRKRGLKVGIYYSILDYHHGIENGTVTQKKIEFIQAQLTELLTNYGPIDYMNLDGWSTWPTTPDFDDIAFSDVYHTVKSLQPNCLIVNHCYESNLAHADVPFADAAGRKYPYAADYMRPTAASDVSQSDWWWDDIPRYRKPRSKAYLLGQLDSYNSHNSVYILNISPGPNGRLDDNVVERLAEVAREWQKPKDVEAAGDNWGYQYDVAENLAFLRPAIQSTTAEPTIDFRARPRAEIAVDGVTEGVAAMEQVALTRKEITPWWQVDLGGPCELDSVTVYLQTDVAAGDRKPLSLSLLNAEGEVEWAEISKPDKVSKDGVLIVELVKGGEPTPVTARHVRIKAIGDTKLGLAEVVVRGKRLALEDR